MKVFMSSVIGGMESLRDAAGAGIRLLGHEVIRAEDFGALAETPQQACLAGVRRADAVVLVLGSRYGAPQASGPSATHEEYREARERCPILAFVQKGMDRDQRQEELLREVQAWGSGYLTHSPDSPNELRDAVIQALHELELSRASGMVDEQELLGRARELVPERRGPVHDCLCVVVAAGPTQQVLRPAELENASLQDDILREALLGEYRVLDDRYGTERSIQGDRLIFDQKYGSLLVTEQGAIRILAQAAIDHSATSFGLPAIVEEDILRRLSAASVSAGNCWTVLIQFTGCQMWFPLSHWLAELI